MSYADLIREFSINHIRNSWPAAAASFIKNENEKLRQKIVSLMGEFGLKITSLANQKVVEFLDVRLDIENDSYGPIFKTW